jgi:hypothetical protein
MAAITANYLEMIPPVRGSTISLVTPVEIMVIKTSYWKFTSHEAESACAILRFEHAPILASVPAGHVLLVRLHQHVGDLPHLLLAAAGVGGRCRGDQGGKEEKSKLTTNLYELNEISLLKKAFPFDFGRSVAKF